MWNTVPQERFPLASRSIVAIISVPGSANSSAGNKQARGPSQSEFTVAPKKKNPDYTEYNIIPNLSYKTLFYKGFR